MSQYTQANRPLKFFTPLGPDALLPVTFEGREAISELFHYELDLLAENSQPVPFDKLLGQDVRVELTLGDGTIRHFHGIVTQLGEGASDLNFTPYRVVLAPALWRLTKRFRFRIFQALSVLDILKKVLDGLKVRFHVVQELLPWNFCVQFYETDFAFASRLMERDGLFYYFEHDADGHTLVVTDLSLDQPDITAPSEVRFDPATDRMLRGTRVTAWRKTQEMCPGKFTYWDYNSQMPDQHLEAAYPILDRVAVGQVEHWLSAGGNEDLEVFQFTGAYGRHFDSLDPGGGQQEGALPHLFEANQHFARLLMEREACRSLRVEGASTCGRFLPGRHFTLAGHAQADGAYLLTRAVHHVRQAGYRPNEESAMEYANEFTAVPKELPFRSQHVTPWPAAHSLQTAVVVGPKDEEIFTDKFGRVKVQFLWDRDGKHDPDSSCWIRVAQPHAGKGFGFVSIPRVGEEVVVGFAGDNPDRPLILGSVYNARNMPPFSLPEHRARTALKSHSYDGDLEQFSGLAIDDAKGREHMQLHAERDLTFTSELNHAVYVNQDHCVNVGSFHVTTVGGGSSAAGSGGGGGDLHPNLQEKVQQIKDTVAKVKEHYPAAKQKAQEWSQEYPLVPPSTFYNPGSWGASLTTTYGVTATATMGLRADAIVGPYWCICIDPLSALGDLAGRLEGTGLLGTGLNALIGGQLYLTLGSYSTLTYGGTLTCNRGTVVTITGKVHIVQKILLAIEKLLALATMDVLKWFGKDMSTTDKAIASTIGGMNLLVIGLIGLVEGLCRKANGLKAKVEASTGNEVTEYPVIRPREQLDPEQPNQNQLNELNQEDNRPPSDMDEPPDEQVDPIQQQN